MGCFHFLKMLIVCISLSGVAMAVSVGENAPDFHGKDLDGKECSLSQFKGRIVVMEWTNPKCPFVRKQYSQDNLNGVGALPAMQKQFTQPSIGVAWIMVASAVSGSPSFLDASGWKAQLKQWDAMPTAMIIDDTGEIAQLFDVWRTPEVFIISREGILLYKGAVDSIRGTDPNEVTSPANLHWLRNGIENALKGRNVIPPETIPYGCPVR